MTPMTMPRRQRGVVRLLSQAAALSAAVLVAASTASVANAAPQAAFPPRCPKFMPNCVDPHPRLDGTELIRNGGFETPSTSSYVPDGWTFSGLICPYMTNSNGAHSGSAFIQFWNDGGLSQTLTIPTSASAANLSYWVSGQRFPDPTDMTNLISVDFMDVDITDLSGHISKRIRSFNDETIPNSWTQIGPCDLSAYKGQTVKLRFLGRHWRTAATQFNVDDVSVQVPPFWSTATYKPC